MLDYIVLGQIPGTSLRLGFEGYLILFGFGLLFYDIKKFHPEKLTKINKKFRVSEKLSKLRPYEKRLVKRLVHIRDNVLSPKLKFLK